MLTFLSNPPGFLNRKNPLYTPPINGKIDVCPICSADMEPSYLLGQYEAFLKLFMEMGFILLLKFKCLLVGNKGISMNSFSIGKIKIYPTCTCSEYLPLGKQATKVLMGSAISEPSSNWEVEYEPAAKI